MHLTVLCSFCVPLYSFFVLKMIIKAFTASKLTVPFNHTYVFFCL